MNGLLIQHLSERAHDPQRVTDDLTGHTPNAPATPETLASVEAALNIQLPETLRRAYLGVGDGNWGPGYGLLPLTGDSYRSSAASLLDETRAAKLPGKVLFCYWGCTVYSVLDSASGRIGLVDLGTEFSDQVSWQAGSVLEWFEAWLRGENLFFSGDWDEEEP